jgi:pyridoxal phosphate enzyme (YggS family)
MSDAAMIDRWREILGRIEKSARGAGRDPASVQLVAVSKTHPFERIEALYRAGQRDFGENYVQEMIEKAEAARVAGLDQIRWHFIGHLQSNKVKVLLPHAHLIHGIGSLRLFEEISKRATGRSSPVAGLIEVNVDEQESKSGARIAELRGIAEAAARLPNVDLRGLMCIPDPDRPAGPREAFRRLAALEADLRPLTKGVLSMGMTSDFEDAIAEGATLVRVGTAIFGARDSK